jgi:hypothetical protein
MKAYTIFRENEYRKSHVITAGAPCDWSKERGATHTLHIPERHSDIAGATRPAILKKTRLLVGIDETPEGDIAWERWVGKSTEWEGTPTAF